MTTHEVLKDCIRSMQEMLDGMSVLVRRDPSKGDKEGRDLYDRWQKTLDKAKEKEKEIRPSTGLVVWEKGQKEASKNYHPPQSKPTG